MAKYKIEISRSAEKQLEKLPKDDQKRVVDAVLRLCEDAFPRGARKLSGYEDVFRIRVGRYRVLYSVSETELIVIVLKIGHRGEEARKVIKKKDRK
ncbi:MAG: type II toxin-antitoxin system RelE/ParE family toxin [Acidobacteriota bacterium]|nr:MAG: type II toxin-antitoxin system RelE/ParE family toxin [Acidobacteriota bacterium]